MVEIWDNHPKSLKNNFFNDFKGTEYLLGGVNLKKEIDTCQTTVGGVFFVSRFILFRDMYWPENLQSWRSWHKRVVPQRLLEASRRWKRRQSWDGRLPPSTPSPYAGYWTEPSNLHQSSGPKSWDINDHDFMTSWYDCLSYLVWGWGVWPGEVEVILSQLNFVHSALGFPGLLDPVGQSLVSSLISHITYFDISTFL